MGGVGVYGAHTGGNSNGGAGVYGTTNASAAWTYGPAAGVYGSNTNTSASAWGVYGEIPTAATAGVGVFGTASNVNNTGYAGQFVNASTGNQVSYGVSGSTSGTGASAVVKAVQGLATGASNVGYGHGNIPACISHPKPSHRMMSLLVREFLD